MPLPLAAIPPIVTAVGRFAVPYLVKELGKIRDALKGFPYQANLCAAIINHANSVGKKLQDDIKQIIQKI